MSAEETKEWLGVPLSAHGQTSVTVSMVEDNLSVKGTVKSYASAIEPALIEAKKSAPKALADLRAAFAEIDEMAETS